MNPRKLVKRWYKYLKKSSKPYKEAASLAWAERTFRFRQADISIFHDFVPPPVGGGHQFLRALWREFERRGFRVENNTMSHTTRACLFNSFKFLVHRLQRLRNTACRMVHRVDGPIGVYRGWDDGTDSRIQQMNQEFADVTVFQSQYSLHKHHELGLSFQVPSVIKNAVDSHIFHPHGRLTFDRFRKVRLISTSWSDNPNKGTPIYKWLEEHLDWKRFDYTFVGRSPIQFEHIRMIPPVDSYKVAEFLRTHDIYITASVHEPCSNSLLEALACGLPVAYMQSGSHAELVGEAGLGFSDQEELPNTLEKLVDEYEDRQASISIPSLADVTDQYLAMMGL